jgi:hypothetical protein
MQLLRHVTHIHNLHGLTYAQGNNGPLDGLSVLFTTSRCVYLNIISDLNDTMLREPLPSTEAYAVFPFDGANSP